MPEIPETLSDYDFMELVTFDRAVESEGFSYAAENYPARFEFAGYEPLDDEDLRALRRRHRVEIDRRWRDDPAAMVDAHNAHLDEAKRREEHRALWAVRFASGYVSPCRTEAEARSLHATPGWNVVALLTRDVPGGQWREVAGAVTTDA